jgi:cell division initiation protein
VHPSYKRYGKRLCDSSQVAAAAVFLAPREIQHQSLKRGRGYDREEVDKLLEHVALSYEQVWQERDELHARIDKLEGELKSFCESERYLRETLVTAQRAADDLRSGAERDAERLKSEALADLRQATAEAELESLRAEIAHARSLGRKLRLSLRAFLEQALRRIGDGAVQEAPVERLADALAPETPTAERQLRLSLPSSERGCADNACTEGSRSRRPLLRSASPLGLVFLIAAPGRRRAAAGCPCACRSVVGELRALSRAPGARSARHSRSRRRVHGAERAYLSRGFMRSRAFAGGSRRGTRTSS